MNRRDALLLIGGSLPLASCSGGSTLRPPLAGTISTQSLDEVMLQTGVLSFQHGSLYVVRSDQIRNADLKPFGQVSSVISAQNYGSLTSGGKLQPQLLCDGDACGNDGSGGGDASSMPVVAHVYVDAGPAVGGMATFNALGGMYFDFGGTLSVGGSFYNGPIFKVPAFNATECAQLLNEYGEQLQTLGNFIRANATPAMVVGSATAALNGALSWGAFLDVAMAVMGSASFLAALAAAGLGAALAAQLAGACLSG